MLTVLIAAMFTAAWVSDYSFGKESDPAVSRGYSIPLIDLAGETQRQVVVDREAGQYLGHPTTVLLEDGKTILLRLSKGHGKGAIVYKRSADGGRTWSETPNSKKLGNIQRDADHLPHGRQSR